MHKNRTSKKAHEFEARQLAVATVFPQITPFFLSKLGGAPQIAIKELQIRETFFNT
jgi:hypothetical protein